MENILTFAGCIQLAFALWGADRIATAPRLVLGLVIFAVLVGAVRRILKEMAAAPKRGTPVRRITRIV